MGERSSLQVTALVPMRHESERVPGKNYRPFAGRPLFHHIIETLLSCRSVQQVVIDTDSPRIQEDAKLAFPGVQLLDRPDHLRGGEVPMNDVLLDAVQRLEGEFFLQTHSTNPLLTAMTVERAIRRFFDVLPTHDSLFTVTRHQSRFWNAAGEPENHNPARLLRTQDLPPLFEENSCLYIFSRGGLIRRGNRLGERPLMFELDPQEAWDIDEESDFRTAEILFRYRRRNGEEAQ